MWPVPIDEPDDGPRPGPDAPPWPNGSQTAAVADLTRQLADWHNTVAPVMREALEGIARAAQRAADARQEQFALAPPPPCGAPSMLFGRPTTRLRELPAGHEGRHYQGILTWPRAADGQPTTACETPESHNWGRPCTSNRRPPHNPCQRTDHHDAHEVEIQGRPFWCLGYDPDPSRVEELAERDEMRRNYERACQTIAAMHEAATGRTGEGPARGVVEDVADVRARAEEAEGKLSKSEGLGHKLLQRAERAEEQNDGLRARNTRATRRIEETEQRTINLQDEHEAHRKALADALGPQKYHLNWDQLIAETARLEAACSEWMADVSKANAERDQLRAAADRAAEVCHWVRDREGLGGMINASQILGLLSLTWPDGNYQASAPADQPTGD